VELIPEIDVPGHTTSFAAAYGEIFGTDGIICLSEESMAGMATLFRELCELFSDSEYIHLGGDEAAIAKWITCDKCLNAFKNRGVDVDTYLASEEGKRELTELMYATFIKDICEVILDCGKTPVVWEGFHKSMNHLIPKQSVIVSWENFYQTAPELLEAGFRVVNGAWKPMYVVTPVVYWSPEEVYNWNIYTWGAVHPGSPYNQNPLHIDPTMQVEGGQLLAWGDQIVVKYPVVAEGVREEQRLIEERTPCLSENVWNRVKPTDWSEFSGRAAQVAELYEAFRSNQ
jgi:hexosaminidase